MTTNDEYNNGNGTTSFFDRSIYNRNESIDLDGLLSLSSNIVLEDDGTGASFSNDNSNNGNNMDFRKNDSSRLNYDIPSVIESGSAQANGVTTSFKNATSMFAEDEKDDDENDTDDNTRSGSQQVVSLGDDDLVASSKKDVLSGTSNASGTQHHTLDGELFETFDDRYDDSNNNNFDDFSYTSSIDNGNNTGSINNHPKQVVTGSIPIPKHTEDNQQQQAQTSKPNSHDSTGSGFFSSLMADSNARPAMSPTISVGAQTRSNSTSKLLSHTPPISTSSDELHRLSKRSRSGSISGRLRSASDFLQENQRKMAAAVAGTSGGTNAHTILGGVSNTETAALLKDLIIAEDSELQNALDQYEEHNDASALEEMITSGALQNRLPPDLDLLGDLDLDFLTMDDKTNSTTAGHGIENENGLRSNVSSMPTSPSNAEKYQYYYPSPSPLFGTEYKSIQQPGAPLLPSEPESLNSGDQYQQFSIQPKRQEQQDHPQAISSGIIESGMPSDSNDGIDDDASLLLQIRKSSNASSYLGLLNNNRFYNSTSNKIQEDRHNKAASAAEHDDGIGDLDFNGEFLSEQSSTQHFSTTNYSGALTIGNSIDDKNNNNEYTAMQPSGRTTPQSMASQDDYLHDERLRSNSLFSALFGDNSSSNNPSSNPNQQHRAETRFESFGSWLEASGRAGPIVSTTEPPTTLSSSSLVGTHASSVSSGDTDVTARKITAATTATGITESIKTASDLAEDSSVEADEEVEDTPSKPISAKKAAAMELAERKRREKQEKREAKEREKELLRLQKLEEKEVKKKDKLEKKLQKDQEKKSALSSSGKKKSKDVHDDDNENSMDVDDDVEYEKKPSATSNQQSQQQQPYEHISGSGRPRSLSDPLLRTSIDDETGLVQVDRPDGWIGAYSPDSRKVRVEKFLAKRDHRVWIKTVKYDVRKNFADSRLRVKGRFVKKEDELLMRELLSLT